MKKDNSQENNSGYLRYVIFIPLVLVIASLATSCLSYYEAKQDIATDLNNAIVALANEKSELWTRHDTLAALRHMHATTHKPLIYQASDVNFRYRALKDEAYFTLALIDRQNTPPKIRGHKIASDSIMLVPEYGADGLAIQIQGFAVCSMASVFAASDQTLPGILLTLSILSMTGISLWQRKETVVPETELATTPAAINRLHGIKLTPMQRQFVKMLLDAPDMRVDKATLCKILWDNKSNAEESLYTLVRRTKRAIAAADIEIICNRGDSYELRVSN